MLHTRSSSEERAWQPNTPPTWNSSELWQKSGDSSSVSPPSAPARKPLKLRPYQERIAAAAVERNTLVVLPTGAGKTLIAATVIQRICGPFSSYSENKDPSALFLVPTRLLVQQQAKALRESIPFAHVAEFTGGIEMPAKFDVLVSTPKAFQVRQLRASSPGSARLDWMTWKVIVFDEVHHVLKEHPYRRLALSLRSSPLPIWQTPRVVGLTASYTYAVGAAAVKKTLKTLCEEMRFECLEAADLKELQLGGYHATAATAEVITEPLHEGEPIVPEGVLPFEKRKPHMMVVMFFDRVKRKQCTPFAGRLVRTVAALEKDLVDAYDYYSPVRIGRPLKAWGSDAYSRRAYDPRFEELSAWYEALRILIASWEEGADAAVLFLRMSGCDGNNSAMWSDDAVVRLSQFWENVPLSFPRLERLKSALLYQYETRVDKPGNEFRGIVFVQQRVTTHIIEYFVRSDPELSVRLTPAVIYAATSPATASLSVSKEQTRIRMQEFAAGDVNLLVATSVAEEGMDIPAANCVVRFDAMVHSVSLVQGRGRARQADSSHIVLAERPDRNVDALENAEAKQLELMRTYHPTVNQDELAKEQEDRRKAQINRENIARPLLDGSNANKNVLMLMNLFAKKTKVDIQQALHKEGDMWCCNLSYSSVLRDVKSKGLHLGRKGAKLAAMEHLRKQLKEQLVNEPECLAKEQHGCTQPNDIVFNGIQYSTKEQDPRKQLKEQPRAMKCVEKKEHPPVQLDEQPINEIERSTKDQHPCKQPKKQVSNGTKCVSNEQQLQEKQVHEQPVPEQPPRKQYAFEWRIEKNPPQKQHSLKQNVQEHGPKELKPQEHHKKQEKQQKHRPQEQIEYEQRLRKLLQQTENAQNHRSQGQFHHDEQLDEDERAQRLYDHHRNNRMHGQRQHPHWNRLNEQHPNQKHRREHHPHELNTHDQRVHEQRLHEQRILKHNSHEQSSQEHHSHERHPHAYRSCDHRTHDQYQRQHDQHRNGYPPNAYRQNEQFAHDQNPNTHRFNERHLNDSVPHDHRLNDHRQNNHRMSQPHPNDHRSNEQHDNSHGWNDKHFTSDEY